MKIAFGYNNHANSFSRVEEEFTLEEYGLTEEEWKKMSEGEKQKLAEQWAYESKGLEIWFREVEN